jgi:hypothetical protein
VWLKENVANGLKKKQKKKKKKKKDQLTTSNLSH